MSDACDSFGFVHPSRCRKIDLSIHYPNKSLLSRPSSFRRYPDLPFELRQNIRNMAIHEARLSRGNSSKPKVMQSLRGIFTTHYSPGYPALSNLACVDKEWQIDVEKINFSCLHLYHSTQCDVQEVAYIQDFANIVTGPRRRYLTDLIINLRLFHKCAEEGARYNRSGSLSPRACTEGFSAYIAHVFEVLATWSDDEVREGLIFLMIEPKIEGKAHRSPDRFGLSASLINLPAVSVISDLWIYPCIGPASIEVSADLVTTLCGRLTRLRSVSADVGHHCCSEETASTPCIERFTRELVNAVPRLEKLKVGVPSRCYWSQHTSSATPDLPISSIESLRWLSYRLEELKLDSRHTQLRQFFDPFDLDDFNPVSDSIQSWPALRHLEIIGRFLYADNISRTQQDSLNEGHLICVGRATRFMPKLEYMWIHNQNLTGGYLGPPRPYGQLRFTFHAGPYGPKVDKSQGLCLSVENHMPSSTVVEIWKDSLMHAQRESLAVEVHRGPVYDMDEMYEAEGPPSEEDWESWEMSMSRLSVEGMLEQTEASSDGETAEA